ncbi:MAG: hypothetical protein E6R03_07400 [Hyphomicrobiaceae bacterium]|nr:MAG: hypothetical protein E6R03_07400 [Hyphomicrobiaceae bacterium]
MKSTDQNNQIDALPVDRNEVDYVWATFQKGKAGEATTVEAALNGVTYSYERGKRVCVPRVVLEECFGHAVFQQFDPQTGVVTESLSYDYTNHGPATKEEVAQFFAKKE